MKKEEEEEEEEGLGIKLGRCGDISRDGASTIKSSTVSARLPYVYIRPGIGMGIGFSFSALLDEGLFDARSRINDAFVSIDRDVFFVFLLSVKSWAGRKIWRGGEE